MITRLLKFIGQWLAADLLEDPTKRRQARIEQELRQMKRGRA
jgi:hypothetical protein